MRMMVLRGDTSPKVEALVNRGNTFPRMNVESHQGSQIHPKLLRKSNSLEAVLCIPWSHYENGSVREQIYDICSRIRSCALST